MSATQRRFALTSFAILSALAAAPAVAQPTFSKAFSPATIGPGAASALVFTIDNAAASMVDNLAFTDVLPAGVTIATPASASTTCAGGLLTAPDGGGTISYSGGSVGATSSCMVTVLVTSSTLGTHMNVSGDLTSSAGSSGPAAADLTVAANYPGFSKSFAPASVGFGGRSTLTFTIDNTLNPSLTFNLVFTDALPPGVVVADPSNATTNCTAGLLSATAGGSVIGFSQGLLAAGETCTIAVDVTGTSIGTHVNISSDLLSSIGGPSRSGGKATDSLTVTSGTIAFSKSFTDDPVNASDTVTLQFALTNLDRFDDATGLTFTDDLDATLSGLVATGLPMMNVCGPGSMLTGTSLLTLTGGFLAADGGSCTFSVTLQVPAGAAAGAYPNTTSNLTGTIGGSPYTGDPATETLFVNDAPALTKMFLTNPVGAGATVTLRFTITNASSTSMATAISFLDNLDTFLNGVQVASLPASGFCGAGSTIGTVILASGRYLSVNGANLPAAGNCSFDVDLTVPVGQAPGTYVNTTTPITGTVNGTPQAGSAASATLTVVGAPALSKQFTDDPVLPGGTVTLEFTIDNSGEAPVAVDSLAFTDDLDATLSGLVATGLPMNDVCGVGSSISGTNLLTFTGGTLAAGASCTFAVTLQVPAMALAGSYVNTTSNLTGMASGVPVTDDPATDTLLVAGLSIAKSFTDDPALPGGTVTLQFTITNDGTQDATGIFFTDNLNAALTGLAAVGLPMNDVCGLGSQIAGTTTLTLTGGNLLAMTTCTFPVTLQVPGGAADGTYVNTTSNLTATLGGSPVVLPPAVDTLTVDGARLDLTKSFTNDPVAAGGMVTLEFTVTNLDANNAASGIAFTDDLDATLSGLVAIGLPMNDVCGLGSQISGAGLLTLTGGNLVAGGSCTFQVTLQVPMGAPAGTVTNTTSAVAGTILMLPVTGSPASDDLTIRAVTFDKAFDGPTTAGSTAVLSFSITNLDTTAPVGSIGFVDDLDAVLSGLVAVGLPQNDVCGAGSTISGTSLITLTNGSLAPSGSCVIFVTVQLPAGAAPGVYPNTTSSLLTAGLPLADPATADLTVEPPPTFAKVFAPDMILAGEVSTLTFTIDNTASTLVASGLDFTDNLPAGMTVAMPAAASTTCTGGTITAVPATMVVSYSGGSVAAGASCTLQVDVTSPTPGAAVNTTGDLTSSSGNSGTATDTLVVGNPPLPTFAKVFAPDSIVAGAVSTLTFTVDNTAAAVPATGLAFTDNLPAGLVVASPNGAVNTCGGALTATSGSGVISLVGGTAGAGATCTISVDVTSATPGMAVNLTGDLTSSSGNSGTATDTLVVGNPPLPTFAKLFAPDTIVATQTSTLTFTIDNSAALVAATALDVTDNLPAAILVANPANVANTCGGTVTATPGTGVVSLAGGTVGAGASCQLSVDVTSATAGAHVNVTGDLTSSSGNSGTATDTLTVDAAPLPVFAKELIGGNMLGQPAILLLTIDNSVSVVDATNVDVVDNLPAGMEVASPENASTTCVGGTLTAVAGGTVVSYTGGTVPAGSTCTVQADVVTTTFGTFVNTTEDLTTSAGNSGPATATLIVGAPPVLIPTIDTVGALALGTTIALLALALLRRRQRLADRG